MLTLHNAHECYCDNRSPEEGSISENDYRSFVDEIEIAPVMNEQGAIECGCVPSMMGWGAPSAKPAP